MSPLTEPTKLVLTKPTGASLRVAPIGRGGDLLYSQAGTPSLDLRFAEKKTLTDYVSGDNLVTFSRNSTATYVDSNGLIQTATTNTPRFDHDPTTGESLGLLVEEARTNLLTYSEEFGTTAAWVRGNVTLDPNVATAPDGSQTADKLIWNSGATSGGLIRQASTDRGTATNPVVRFTLAGSGIATVLSALAPGSNYDITNVGNGWYRCWLYDTTAGQTLSVYAKAGEFNAVQLQFYTINRYIYVRDTVATQGDGTSGVYLWGAQLEAGSFPTSYIPTAGTTVTRGADVASITGANFSSWYNQSEGTFFTVHEETSQRGTSGAVFSGTGLRLYSYNNNTRVQFLYGSGTGYFGYSQSPVNPPAYVKTSFYYQGLNYGGVIENTNVVNLTTTTPPNPTFIEVKGSGALDAFNGHISRLTYWPQRLPDATLQTITT